MPFFQVKNFFLAFIPVNKVFRFLGVVSHFESNLDTFKDIGRICLKVVFFSVLEIQESLSDCQFGPGS